MEPQDERLADLSQFARGELARIRAQASFVPAARQRLFAAPPPRPRSRLAWPFAAAAVMSAAALGLYARGALQADLALPATAGPLSFTVEAGPGALGRWVEAGHADRVPLRFSDASVIDAHRHARVRVSAVEERGARVEIESGAVDVSVVHRRSTRWFFTAGPFVVHVTGTRFELGWEPGRGSLSIAMAEGAVEIEGCDLASPRRVEAGARVRLTCPQEAEIISSAKEEPDLQKLASEPPRLPRSRASSPVVRPSPEASTTWRRLYDRGDFAAALARAETDGFERACATGSAHDVHALAELARLGGKAELARHGLSTLRRRFPHTDAAAVAGFTLGRVVAEMDRDQRAALPWFERYLRERPDGPLAEDAMGRIMGGSVATGDRARATQIARQYLERFGGGRYTGLARDLTAP